MKRSKNIYVYIYWEANIVFIVWIKEWNIIIGSVLNKEKEEIDKDIEILDPEEVKDKLWNKIMN